MATMQLSLFDTIDYPQLICEFFVNRYERYKSHYENFSQNFDEFVLDHFHTHCGGTAPQILENAGFDLWACGPSGFKLTRFDNDYYDVKIAKNKVLSILGIKDNRKPDEEDDEP